MFLRSIKTISSLISKAVSNIYLSSYWEKPTFSKHRFSKLKYSSPSQYLASSNTRRCHWILKLQLKNQRSWKKPCETFTNLKIGSCLALSQMSGAKSIRFFLTGKLHQNFAMASSSGSKFDLKIEKGFKITVFLEECHKCKKLEILIILRYHLEIIKE